MFGAVSEGAIEGAYTTPFATATLDHLPLLAGRVVSHIPALRH
jgi:hypothetical protein